MGNPLGIWTVRFLAVKFPSPSSKSCSNAPHVRPAGWVCAPPLDHFFNRFFQKHSWVSTAHFWSVISATFVNHLIHDDRSNSSSSKSGRDSLTCWYMTHNVHSYCLILLASRSALSPLFSSKQTVQCWTTERIFSKNSIYNIQQWRTDLPPFCCRQQHSHWSKRHLPSWYIKLSMLGHKKTGYIAKRKVDV